MIEIGVTISIWATLALIFQVPASMITRPLGPAEKIAVVRSEVQSVTPVQEFETFPI